MVFQRIYIIKTFMRNNRLFPRKNTFILWKVVKIILINQAEITFARSPSSLQIHIHYASLTKWISKLYHFLVKVLKILVRKCSSTRPKLLALSHRAEWTSKKRFYRVDKIQRSTIRLKLPIISLCNVLYYHHFLSQNLLS